ncbi:hypothetical protein LXL04_033638 [Taraxacum kok-saghyz]
MDSRNSSFRQSSASKIDQLYEIAYLSDESKIPISQLPIVNPYNVFNKPVTRFSRKIKKLIGSTSNQQAKEYVQTSKFDFFQLPATSSEHLVTLSIPPDLPRSCLHQGYTHIHFGAIRLALTFHGRKGLPAFSRIALVDTRFVEYQHACIGTIQTTLNAGTIFVTFYPNFDMPLNDPSLFTALKAQIQIGGTPQVNTFQATFHYQMAYRVQNHSLDIMVLGQANSGDALFLDVDSNATPTCTYVPRQLSRDEILKLLLDKWVTNYEQIHQAHIAKELVHFPNELRSQKEIQQFLGIPSTTDKRILQTDASDDYWGAVLLVEDSSSVRSICGYKSGTFKVSEQHYHSTFKEILAVKWGIEKFQFHLIRHASLMLPFLHNPANKHPNIYSLRLALVL